MSTGITGHVDRNFAAARYEYAYHLRLDERLTFDEIGRRFGVGKERARCLAWRGARDRLRELRKQGVKVDNMYELIAALIGGHVRPRERKTT